jgi:hypothetical protein
MPRLSINYQKTVIYKIVCNDLTVTYTYVGMTTDFTKRKYAHKNSSNNITTKNFNLKVYQIIRENGGWINWTMLEIEAYPCKTDIEARLKEREWYERLNATMNSIIPIVTEEEKQASIEKCKISIKANCIKVKAYKKECAEKKKEEIRAYKKEYAENNKEENKAYNKEWYENNKEAHKNSVKIYTENNKDKIKACKKEWYEINKEKIKAYQKEYRQNNKNKI